MAHIAAYRAFFTKMTQYYPTLSPLSLIQASFSNFRSGKGLLLTRESYLICTKHKLYKFTAIPRPTTLDSRHIAVIDRLSTSPFYINTKTVYLSDTNIAFSLTLTGDDFDIFLELHK